MIEARHTSHSGAISKSGGKLATSTKAFVCQIARDVVGPRKHFQCASASHQTRQPCHWTTSRHHTSPNFKMRQYCFLAAGETHVAGQGKFASVTGRAPSDAGD